MKHSKFADKVLQDTKKQIEQDKPKVPKILTPDGLFDAINKITQDYKRNNNL